MISSPGFNKIVLQPCDSVDKDELNTEVEGQTIQVTCSCGNEYIDRSATLR